MGESGFSRWRQDQVSPFCPVQGAELRYDSFSMPDVHSIGLGGGSRVRSLDGGQVRVGPDSVGNRVSASSSIIFAPSE